MGYKHAFPAGLPPVKQWTNAGSAIAFYPLFEAKEMRLPGNFACTHGLPVLSAPLSFWFAGRNSKSRARWLAERFIGGEYRLEGAVFGTNVIIGI